MPGVDDVTLARSEVRDVDRAVDAEALTAGLEAEAALAAEEVLHATELRGDLHALTAGHPVAADDEAGAIGLDLERQHVAGQDAGDVDPPALGGGGVRRREEGLTAEHGALEPLHDAAARGLAGDLHAGRVRRRRETAKDGL